MDHHDGRNAVDHIKGIKMINTKYRRNLVGVAAKVKEGEYAIEVKGQVDGKWIVLGEVLFPRTVHRIKVAAVRMRETS